MSKIMRGNKPLVKNQLYIRKYGQVGKAWLLVRFRGFDKMEAEFEVVSRHSTEAEAESERKQRSERANTQASQQASTRRSKT